MLGSKQMCSISGGSTGVAIDSTDLTTASLNLKSPWGLTSPVCEVIGRLATTRRARVTSSEATLNATPRRFHWAEVRRAEVLGTIRTQ